MANCFANTLGMYNTISLCSLLIILTLQPHQILSQNAGTAGSPRGQHCRGFRSEEVPYPSPYIGNLDRADRCKQLFPKYNSSGLMGLSYVGKNTYHNPCKVECALCTSEYPDNNQNVIRQYPGHIHFKDEIGECTNNEVFELFEQYMEDGIQCGPTHVCDNLCCVDHPELFPTKKRRVVSTPPPQNIPPEWTLPLNCEEEGYFRNPNDCHRFYRCHSSNGGKSFARTLFACNPISLVFDEQFNVCVSPEDATSCDDTHAGN